MNWLLLSDGYVNMDHVIRAWYDSNVGDMVLTFADPQRADLRYPALSKDADAVRTWLNTHSENPGGFNNFRIPRGRG